MLQTSRRSGPESWFSAPIQSFRGLATAKNPEPRGKRCDPGPWFPDRCFASSGMTAWMLDMEVGAMGSRDLPAPPLVLTAYAAAKANALGEF